MQEAAVQPKVAVEVSEILIPRSSVAEMLTIQGVDLSCQNFSVRSKEGALCGCQIGIIEVRGVGVLLSENFVIFHREGESILMEPILRNEIVGIRSPDIQWINPRFCRKCADLTGKMFSRSSISGTQYYCQTKGCKNKWKETP